MREFGLPSNRLRAAARQIHTRYTDDRAAGAKAGFLAGPEALVGYLAAYAPQNYFKVLVLLQAHKPRLGRRWLDFGCGPGTATMAALEHAARTGDVAPRQIMLVEKDDAFRKLAKRLVENYADDLGIEVEVLDAGTLREGLEAFEEDPIDLALAANVLNELPDGSPIEALWARTAGTLFSLEPGHRVSSQKLSRLRERLVKAGGIRILGPCMHHGACPVVRSNHWCHFSEPTPDQRLVHHNEQLFGDKRPWLKFSYLMAERSPEGKTHPWDGRSFRAIGDLHPSGEGQLAIDLCQPDAKRPLRMKYTAPLSLQKKLVRGARVILQSATKAAAGDDRIAEAAPLSPRIARPQPRGARGPKGSGKDSTKEPGKPRRRIPRR